MIVNDFSEFDLASIIITTEDALELLQDIGTFSYPEIASRPKLVKLHDELRKILQNNGISTEINPH